MTNGQLTAHHIHQVVQVSTRRDERHELAITRDNFRPVGTVQIRYVEVVAHLATRFLEDLCVLALGLPPHAQCRRETARAGGGCCRRRGIDQEQRGLRAAGAIQQLLAVRADGVRGHTTGERNRLALLERVAIQRPTGRGLLGGTRRIDVLPEEHCPRRTTLHQRVVA